MIDLLTSIADGIGSALAWLGDLMADLAYVAESIASAVAAIPGYLSWLPTEVLAAVLALLSIVVIYRIIGR